jgi:hypothetical protein
MSALAWVFVLVLASIPVTAIVFVFGGVAPEDVIRGYIVLFATVIGLGSIGIFFSALTRRTGASTGLTFVVTLALVIGTAFVYIWLVGTAPIGPNGLRKTPSEAILYLNPFVAQADVACGTEDGFGGTCGVIATVLGADPNSFPNTQPGGPVGLNGGFVGGGVGFNGGPVPVTIGGPGVVVVNGVAVQGDGTNPDVQAATLDSLRDRFWPKTVIAFLVLAAVLTLASVQFVSPTRRWHPNVRGRLRRLVRRKAAA